MAIGMLNGMITATTPYGSRRVMPNVVESSTALWPAIAATASWAERFQTSTMARPFMISLTPMRVPLSEVSRKPSSAPYSSKISAAFST